MATKIYKQPKDMVELNDFLGEMMTRRANGDLNNNDLNSYANVGGKMIRNFTAQIEEKRRLGDTTPVQFTKL